MAFGGHARGQRRCVKQVNRRDDDLHQNGLDRALENCLDFFPVNFGPEIVSKGESNALRGLSDRRLV
jgi:hypothetical protein